MCLLADICNHTWIPECGRERSDGHLRLFIDECDMYEYNCDKEKYYETQNYSDCFDAGPCPTNPPCPSVPTCPNHRFHRMGQRYIYVTPNGRRVAQQTPKPTPKVSLPYHMLHGKRRYTPIPKIRKQKMKQEAMRKSLIKPTTLTSKTKITTKKTKSVLVTKITKKTIILRKESFIKHGKVFMKVIKAYITKSMGKSCTKDSDFLE